ncbi:hypothetical protein EDC96DRAFT_547801 [Choanephora cucurbitarum]|nr:hypothetical protein EDC96DRAFT_547801 [Choanephora cucurbitarum]
MPRNQPLSTSPNNSNNQPALLSRGFASLRRAHRRLSNAGSTQESVNPIRNTMETAISPDEPSLLTEQTSVRPRLRLVPNVGLSSRSFVFEIIDKELDHGVMYRVGRFSDRNVQSDRFSFKSKVVSRNHAEIWTENGKVFIHDIGSSSGTFVNRIRLSPPSHVSSPHELKDGDTVQLGVDYQGGLEPIYRAVRIRVEINRQTQNANNPFTRTAFQQLRNHLVGQHHLSTSPQGEPNIADLSLQREATKIQQEDVSDASKLVDMMSRHPHTSDVSRADIQECCICLYAIAPFQALFIAPCSHIFHFKCLRPIVFQNYPGFSCPLCRSYFDLEASVAVEVDEVLEAMQHAKEQQKQSVPINTVPEEIEEEPEPPVTTSVHNDDDDEEESRPSSSSSSISRQSDRLENNTSVLKKTPLTQDTAGTTTEQGPSQAHRLGRQGELLSTTLVGSPMFDTNVVLPNNDA